MKRGFTEQKGSRWRRMEELVGEANNDLYRHKVELRLASNR